MLAAMDEPGPAGALHERDPRPYLMAGTGVACVSVVLMAAAGPPYLSIESLSPWLVTYAVGAFCALFSLPFVLHRGLGGTLEEDARWERALLRWGAVTLGVLAVAALCAALAGWDTGSAAGALGIVTGVEALLVLGTLVVWLISG